MVDDTSILDAIRATADENGEVAWFAGKIASELGLPEWFIRKQTVALASRGALIRIGYRRYRLPDADEIKAKAEKPLKYHAARACGIEPATRHIWRVTDLSIRSVAISVARVPSLERPLPDIGGDDVGTTGKTAEVARGRAQTPKRVRRLLDCYGGRP